MSASNHQFFHPRNHLQSPRHEIIHARYEMAYTVVDFLAAISLIVGAALYFIEHTVQHAMWAVLIGSVFMALRPTLRLFREIAYMRAGRYEMMQD